MTDPATVSGAYLDLSERLATYALSIIGGSIAIIVGTSYLRPDDKWGRTIYWLFLLGWFCLGCSIYLSNRIARGHVAAQMGSYGCARAAIKVMNAELGQQLSWFAGGLAVFAVWLVLFLVWWILGASSPTHGD